MREDDTTFFFTFSSHISKASLQAIFHFPQSASAASLLQKAKFEPIQKDHTTYHQFCFSTLFTAMGFGHLFNKAAKFVVRTIDQNIIDIVDDDSEYINEAREVN